MNSFNSRIVIVPEISYQNRLVLGINICVCLIVAILFFTIEYEHKKIALIFVVCAIIIINSFFDGIYENPKPYLKDSLLITTNSIEFNHNIFYIEDVQNIKIAYDAYDKEKIQENYNKYRTSNGIDNYIEFKVENIEYKLRFYTASLSEYENLRKVLFDWYINEYDFYEGFELGRTYLLRSLNYAEIQEFKQTLIKLRKDNNT